MIVAILVSWFVLSVPFSMLVGSFIAFGNEGSFNDYRLPLIVKPA